MTNATIAGEHGQQRGGIFNTGTLTAINATIADNTISSSGTGGGLEPNWGRPPCTTRSSPRIRPAQHGQQRRRLAGPDQCNNLFGTGGSGGLTTFDNNLINVANPLLGTLANNGGPSPLAGQPILTLALLAGSPAIDAGSNTIPGVTIPTTDQRGRLRGPAGLDAGSTVDIGAYEASSSYLVTTTTDSTDMGTLRAGRWMGQRQHQRQSGGPRGRPGQQWDRPGEHDRLPDIGAFATAQTITLSPTLGPIIMSNSTTPESIDGTASNGLTISGGGAVGVISVASGTTATLTGLTITGGNSTIRRRHQQPGPGSRSSTRPSPAIRPPAAVPSITRAHLTLPAPPSTTMRPARTAAPSTTNPPASSPPRMSPSPTIRPSEGGGIFNSGTAIADGQHHDDRL